MRRLKLLSACFASLFATSCATIPPISKHDYVHVADVLYSVECELKDAIEYLARFYPFAETQLVQVTYELKVGETGAGAGDAMIVVPISNGTFSVGFTAGLITASTRDTSLTVRYETAQLTCPDYGGVENKPVKIEGGVGLSNWLVRTADALDKANETPTAMSYKIEFDIIVAASVNPKFGIQKISGHQYGGGLQVSGSRQKLHSVFVSTTNIKEGNIAEAERRLDREVQQFLLQNIRRF